MAFRSYFNIEILPGAPADDLISWCHRVQEWFPASMTEEPTQVDRDITWALLRTRAREVGTYGSWYEWEKDLAAFSRRWPTLRFLVWRWCEIEALPGSCWLVHDGSVRGRTPCGTVGCGHSDRNAGRLADVGCSPGTCPRCDKRWTASLFSESVHARNGQYRR